MPFGLPLESCPSFRVTGLSLKGMRMNHPCLACFGPAHKSCPACEFPMFQSGRQMPLSSPFNVHAFVLSLERPLYGFLMASLDDTGSLVD